MDTKNIVRATLILGLFSGAALLSWYQFFSPISNPTNLTSAVNTSSSTGWKFPVYQFIPSGQVTDSNAYSELRKEMEPKGLPVRIRIPVIGVDAAIEDAYITPDGRMDIPAGSNNVAWFALGPRPGQIGSAVIGGHYGIDNGVPKVFYRLNNLEVGDLITVVDDQRKNISFEVQSIKVYERNADATSVFISNDGQSHLNLVTCDGIWNRVNDSYPNRRVIFADRISTLESNDISQINPTVTIRPSLPEAGVSDTFLSTTLKDLSQKPPVTLLFSFIVFLILGILAKIIFRK